MLNTVTLHEFWWGSLVFPYFFDVLGSVGWKWLFVCFSRVTCCAEGFEWRLCQNVRVFSMLQRKFISEKTCLLFSEEKNMNDKKTLGSSLAWKVLPLGIYMSGGIEAIVRCSVHTCADQLGLLWRMGNIEECLLQSLPQEQAVQRPEMAMSITVAVWKGWASDCSGWGSGFCNHGYKLYYVILYLRRS